MRTAQSSEQVDGSLVPWVVHDMCLYLVESAATDRSACPPIQASSIPQKDRRTLCQKKGFALYGFSFKLTTPFGCRH